MAPIGKFSGVSKTGFSRLDNVLAANIGGVDNVDLVLGPAPGTLVDIHATYTFNFERGWRSLWRPSNAITVTNALGFSNQFPNEDDQCAWVNGVPDDIDSGGDVSTTNNNPQTTWNSKEIRPWFVSFKNTSPPDTTSTGATLSGGTGPGGGLSTAAEGINDGVQSSYVPASQQGPDDLDISAGRPRLSRFIFTENSTSNHGDGSYDTIAHVTRLLFLNPVGSNGFMQDQNNNLILKFFYHTRGSSFGSLEVWGGTNSNLIEGMNADDDYLTFINGPGIFGGKLYDSGDLDDLPQSGITNNYVPVEVSLNDMKNAQINSSNQAFHILYFVHQGMTSWDSDLAIGGVQIKETVPNG